MTEKTPKSDQIRLRLGPVASEHARRVPVGERANYIDDLLMELDENKRKDFGIPSSVVKSLQDQLAGLLRMQHSLHRLIADQGQHADHQDRLTRALINRMRVNSDNRDHIFRDLENILQEHGYKLPTKQVDDDPDLKSRLDNLEANMDVKTHSAVGKLDEEFMRLHLSGQSELMKNR